MKTLAIAMLVLGACCDGLSIPTVEHSLDGGVETATVMPPDADDNSPCVAPYARRNYYPSANVYCGPTTDARLEMPCANGQIIGWCGEGVVRCATE